jgi:hypothetical protein
MAMIASVANADGIDPKDPMEQITSVSIDKLWVYIHTHFPLQGEVCLSGKVAQWVNCRGVVDNSPGPDAERVLEQALLSVASK